MTPSLEEGGEGIFPAEAIDGQLTGFTGILVRKILSLLKSGVLTIELPGGMRVRHAGARPGPAAAIKLHSWRLIRRLALNGDIGLARSYVDGDWSTPDLTALFDLGLVNSAPLMDAISGSPPFRALNWLAHRLKANTRQGSRRNIEAHYDLGNDFYRTWLDASMSYSSALYRSEDMTLEECEANGICPVTRKPSKPIYGIPSTGYRIASRKRDSQTHQSVSTECPCESKAFPLSKKPCSKKLLAPSAALR